MKTIFLRIDDSLYDKVNNFLHSLSCDKIQIYEDDIPFVSKEEQAEIEELLKNPECHSYECIETIEI